MAQSKAGVTPLTKSLDLICIGRSSVDIYAQQYGSRLEDVASFAKYLGGSSTNIAACSARMGLKSALITRVGNEHLGRFIREQLQREGVNTDYVITDPDRFTALVFLGIKDKDTFPLVFYRENCADMAIAEDDISSDFIASGKALLITGTHFSAETVLKSSLKALKLARENKVKTALDIDYRPVLWGLTEKGDGETRFIANEGVTQHVQSILPWFDLIVGTEEEIHIAGGSEDTIEALRAIRSINPDATLVLKRGALGATVYEGDISDNLDDGVSVKGVNVEVLNVLGAGDAFMAGFMRGWLNEEGHAQSLTYANACGALVVSRNGCTPAMPTVEELDYYLANSDQIPRPDINAELNYLHRVTTRVNPSWGELCIHAFDHRIQLVEMAKSCNAPSNKVPRLKDLLLSATQQVADSGLIQGHTGILCDDTFGQNALNQATGNGWWIGRPVELPKSYPIKFEGGSSIGSRLINWPLEHIVKCLVYYSPDDENQLKLTQEQRIKDLYSACLISGHELLLEIIPPEGAGDYDNLIPRSVQRFYESGIRPDWWKLPSIKREAMQDTLCLIEEHSPHCHGVVILGLDAPIDELGASFKAYAGLEKVKGFAVGRSIFSEPSRAWLSNDINDDELISQVAQNYQRVIDHWQQRSL